MEKEATKSISLKGKLYSKLLFVSFIVCCFAVWTYITWNCDEVLLGESVLNFARDTYFKDPAVVKAADKCIEATSQQKKIVLLWLKPLEEFQVQNFYIIDSYLRKYPTAKIEVLTNSLPVHFFNEFSMLGYAISVQPLSMDFLDALAKQRPEVKKWYRMRSKLRQTSKNHHAYLEAFVQAAVLLQEDCLLANFDYLLVNPLEKYAPAHEDQIVLDASQFSLWKIPAVHRPLVQKTLVELFDKSEEAFNSDECNFNESLLKKIVNSLTDDKIFNVESLVFTKANVLNESDTGHASSKIAGILKYSFLLVQINVNFGEFAINSPLTKLLFEVQLFNRAERSSFFINFPSYYSVDVELPVDIGRAAFLEELAVVAGLTNLSARNIKLTLKCRYCGGFYIKGASDAAARTLQSAIDFVNPITIEASSFKDLNVKLTKLRVLMNVFSELKKSKQPTQQAPKDPDDERGNEKIMISTHLAVDQQLLTGVFPLFEMDTELTVIVRRSKYTPKELFFELLRKINETHPKVAILVGYYELDEANLAEHVNCKQVTMIPFSSNESAAKLFSKLLSLVKTENFFFMDDQFEFPGVGVLEKLFLEMNTFDLVAAEPIETVKVFQCADFGRNSAKKLFRIKDPAYRSPAHKKGEFYSNCYGVDFVPNFFLSKVFLFDEILEIDFDTFKSEADAGFFEDLFLNMKKFQLKVATCPNVMTKQSASFQSGQQDYSAFLRKYNFEDLFKFGMCIFSLRLPGNIDALAAVEISPFAVLLTWKNMLQPADRIFDFYFVKIELFHAEKHVNSFVLKVNKADVEASTAPTKYRLRNLDAATDYVAKVVLTNKFNYVDAKSAKAVSFKTAPAAAADVNSTEQRKQQRAP